jgi:hypothetical protein
MNLIEHLEYVIGLVERSASQAEVKSALIGMREEIEGYEAASAKKINLPNQTSQVVETPIPESTLVPYAGVLWKRDGVAFERNPYCPKCPDHRAMLGHPATGFHFDPHLWLCTVCGFQTNFNGRPKA